MLSLQNGFPHNWKLFQDQWRTYVKGQLDNDRSSNATCMTVQSTFVTVQQQQQLPLPSSSGRIKNFQPELVSHPPAAGENYENCTNWKEIIQAILCNRSSYTYIRIAMSSPFFWFVLLIILIMKQFCLLNPYNEAFQWGLCCIAYLYVLSKLKIKLRVRIKAFLT